MHHIRSEWKSATFRSTRYYCGIQGFNDDPACLTKEAEADRNSGPPATKEELQAMDHCVKCLFAKWKHKGEAYMLEHGFPRVKRIQNEYGNWKKVVDR